MLRMTGDPVLDAHLVGPVRWTSHKGHWIPDSCQDSSERDLWTYHKCRIRMSKTRGVAKVIEVLQTEIVDDPKRVWGFVLRSVEHRSEVRAMTAKGLWEPFRIILDQSGVQP